MSKTGSTIIIYLICTGIGHGTLAESQAIYTARIMILAEAYSHPTEARAIYVCAKARGIPVSPRGWMRRHCSLGQGRIHSEGEECRRRALLHSGRSWGVSECKNKKTPVPCRDMQCRNVCAFAMQSWFQCPPIPCTCFSLSPVSVLASFVIGNNHVSPTRVISILVLHRIDPLPLRCTGASSSATAGRSRGASSEDARAGTTRPRSRSRPLAACCLLLGDSGPAALTAARVFAATPSVPASRELRAAT